MQHRVVNRAGKPLTRFERTTDTDSLKLAKELYPGVLIELNQELAERSGSILATKEAASQRLVSSKSVWHSHQLNVVLGLWRSLWRLSFP
ncbi:hypothetical protein KUL97_01070 [Synechococcus sp. HK05]|uniref:hypothetical protein n=1 Tax=Synechococcus sp. HK05 TaxID=2725975 RepID=UPI001C3948F9|nr:hypothetical protein [Synechococcus sp. HK05]MBV2350292.1 hypothetical protein [Synechococcus sp. HK05]